MMSYLGERLVKKRDEDFSDLINFYKKFEINEVFFKPKNIDLLKLSHSISFAFHLFISKLEDIPDSGKPYLQQMKSNSIQIISNISIGNKSALKLHERLLIENTFRYIYYIHHEIEHTLLQQKPSKYIIINELFSYVKNHPYFIEVQEDIGTSVDILNSKYSELSREIHTSTLKEMEVINNIKSLHNPITEPKKEMQCLILISQNTLFILGYFHRDKYVSLSHDERPIITSILTKSQVRTLSGMI